MALTNLTLKAAKPAEKTYKLSDGGGLFVQVEPKGSKYWRLAYRFLGKQKTLALGVYPEVTLAEARERASEARKLLANGTDPSTFKKSQMTMAKDRAANSFEVVARRWHGVNADGWSESYAKKSLRNLELYMFPWIGGKPVTDLRAPDFLECARRLENTGKVDTAHRVIQLSGQVMRFAIVEGVATYNPVPDLKGALSTVQIKHMPSVTDPLRVGELLRAFEGFKGTLTVQCALKLAPLVFTRPNELRKMMWAHVDLEAGLWSIPGEMMKMREPHLVPLSTQALAILREIEPLSGDGDYVFQGGRDPRRPMSEAAINAALQRLGIDTKTELTGHGFRAMARTLLHERLGFEPEVIEQQLAHKTAGPLGAAYARAKFIDRRTVMMQSWADYLDKLKAGADVIPFPSANVA